MASRTPIYTIAKDINIDSNRILLACKSIGHLQKTKEALLVSKKHLLSADSKSQDLTVKKLTKNNPTMKKKFNDLRNDEDLK